MKYALDFSLVGRGISGIKWDGKKEEKFRLESLRERLEFLEEPKAGDEVYLVSGGLSREVTKKLSQRGVKVFLLPGTRLKKERKRGETMATTLKRLSQEKPKTFNVWSPEEAEILSLTLAFREWQETMKARTITENRIRQDFYRKVLERPNDYKDLTSEELKEMAREEIEKDPHYQWLRKREKDFEKEVKEIIQEMPLYQRVFANLEGCGPLIAARIIVYVRDINRFRNWEALATFAGFGLKDGKKQRKEKGKSLGYHPQLKSAILHLWIKGQLLRWQRGALSEILRARIQKEREEREAGIEKSGTPVGRAIWWLGKKLIRQIYRQWRNFEKNRAP